MLSNLEGPEGEYIFQCLRRLSQHLPPQEYQILQKDNKTIMFGVKNMFKRSITKQESKGVDFSSTEFVPSGPHFKREKKKVGVELHNIDLVKRTVCFKAAVIDTDGAALQEFFKIHNYKLLYRNILTSNSLLQRFFQNIYYWRVDDYKFLVAVHPNYETSIYGGVKKGMVFEDFGKHLQPTTLGYGYAMPPFFRDNRLGIREFIENIETFQVLLTNQFQDKMYGHVPHEVFNQHQEGHKQVDSSYCQFVLPGFYASKLDYEKGKYGNLSRIFEKISLKQRTELYKGDEFIQCYKIKKVSEDEITVEPLDI